jgi:hypothetical protein
MKNHFLLTEEEKKRIRLLHDKNNQIDGTSILREQAWLRKLLIRSVKTVSNLTSKMAKASLKSLDDVVGAIYRPSNIVKGVNKAGQQVDMIKSYNPKTPPIPRETIESIIRLVDEKKLTVTELDEIMKSVPAKLGDGTPFRETLHKELKGLLTTPKISRGASTIIVGGTTLGAIAQLVGCPDIFSELLGAMKGWLSTEGPSSAHVPTPEEKENLYRFKVKYWAPVDGYPAWDNTVFKGEEDVLPSLEQFPITGHIGVTPALNINQYEEKLASQVEKHEISYNELVKRVGEYKQPLPPDLVAGKKTYKLDWGPWGVSSNEDWSTLPTSQYYIWLTPDQVKHYISVWTHYNSTTEGKAQVSNLWNLCGKGYNLKTNNCADATATSLGINTAGDGMTIPYVALEKIINKYPSQKIS